jgi:hypothetical protein
MRRSVNCLRYTKVVNLPNISALGSVTSLLDQYNVVSISTNINYAQKWVISRGSRSCEKQGTTAQLAMSVCPSVSMIQLPAIVVQPCITTRYILASRCST